MFVALVLALMLPQEGHGPAPDRFGSFVASAGDIDRDGSDDLLIGESRLGPDEDALVFARVVSAKTGALLLSLTNTTDSLEMDAVGTVGDVDGDHVPDILTAFSTRSSEPGDFVTGLEIRSGKSGRVLCVWRIEIDEKERPRHFHPDIVKDMDGDGIRDVLLGESRGRHGAKKLAAIWTLSGKDLSVRTRVAVQHEGAWANDWCQPGDLDGDGTRDVVITVAPGAQPNAKRLAISGAQGTPIAAWAPDASPSRRTEVAPAGDVDRDGVPDLFITTIKAFRPEPTPVTIAVVSGATGKPIETHASAIHAQYGYGPIQLGDVDGDGLPDMALLQHRMSALSGTPGAVTVFSGRDLSPLYVVRQNSRPVMRYEHFGITGCALGDVDGDGIPDLAIGAMSWWSNQFTGCVEVFSGKDGAFLRLITKASLEPGR